MAHASKAKKVLICSVLPRTTRLASNSDIFEHNRKYYNRVLKNECGKSDVCTFTKIRGYERFPDRSQKPVSSWSSDGIHPDDFSRYSNLMGFELLRAAHELKKQ